MSKQFRIIMGFWSFVDMLLLAAAVASIVFSIVERKPDLMANIAISTEQLNAGLIMGVVLLASWIVSIIAVLSPTATVTGFVVLNWMLIMDVIAILVVGTSLWFYTLHIEDNYLAVWTSLPDASKLAVQNKFSCCGYFMPNDTTAAIGGFCANQTFIDSLVNATATTQNACIAELTGYGEPMLNQIFTLTYGFMAVAVSLFLASLCVIHTRREKERFRKIDAKRGGGGFV
ncbi:tetraspanin [Fomitopsis serialis]|uniref:tetraspanin n=1 Tax=Fomitopsis serialis TaxID=139415 RepID=UPI0020080C62|nr:tetraspanin [Neoantrodia serialis]KAH9925255.1 tetraspanin [Neoantrodia serialis]